MKKTPVATTEDGQCFMLAPDVCFVPAPPPPGGVPTPFPNKAANNDAKEITEKVLIRNKKVLYGGGEIPKSMGDEPGCAQPEPAKLGTKSRKQRDKVKYAQKSDKVKFEGKGVVCMGASTEHNNGNTMGKHVVPSQQTVIASW